MEVAVKNVSEVKISVEAKPWGLHFIEVGNMVAEKVQEVVDRIKADYSQYDFFSIVANVKNIAYNRTRYTFVIHYGNHDVKVSHLRDITVVQRSTMDTRYLDIVLDIQ